MEEADNSNPEIIALNPSSRNDLMLENDSNYDTVRACLDVMVEQTKSVEQFRDSLQFL